MIKSFEAFHGYGPQKKRVLIEQKRKFLPLLAELTDEDDAKFKVVRQIDRWTAMSFIKVGEPSEWYLEQILDILKSKGVDTSSIQEEVVRESYEDVDILTVSGFEKYLTGVVGVELKKVDDIISYLVSKGVNFENDVDDEGDDHPLFGYNLN